ncbi:E3 ubiquitin-protein ligase XIAP-like [Ylistrum balloti]|uniref:E3 ubiquitin-protein ligase XIAP-like n=1 Tax=Ylistrum balloti TaxID=509963 RepID=UPI0029058E5B|nr:E3 ubiquitin-protein ligase XIAP-like [Ylistrum balloti]
MGQRDHVNAKSTEGSKSKRKKKPRNKQRKKLKAKRRKRRMSNYRCCEQNSVLPRNDKEKNQWSKKKDIGRKHIADRKFDKMMANENGQNLRDIRFTIIKKFDEFLTPERDIIWKQFLNLMEGIIHIPRKLLIKANNITDIIHILRKGKISYTFFQAISCLMQILRKIDSNVARDIDHIIQGVATIEDRTSNKGITRNSALDETNDQVKQSQDEHAPSNTTDQKIKKSDMFETAALEGRTKEPSDVLSSEITDMTSSIVQPLERNATKIKERGYIFRISSYGHWQIDNVRTGRLVDGGFSCMGTDSNTVECNICELVVNVCDLNDTTPLDYHMRESPNCSFVRQENSYGKGGQDIGSFDIDDQSCSGNQQKYDNKSEHLLTIRCTQKQNLISEVEVCTIINLQYTEENIRIGTYESLRLAPHNIANMAKAGFFYTGHADILKCFHCDIGLAEWNPDDNLWLEHARHSPECPYLREQKGQEYINSVQIQWDQIYKPKHQEYSTNDSRRRTFENAKWTKDEVLQSPEHLSAAGFFSTGSFDTVRCFYCDGELSQWEPDEEPWAEHARWFPHCRYLLKMKGSIFIKNSTIENISCGIQSTGASAVTMANISPVPCEPVDDVYRIMERQNPIYSPAALSVLSMGYTMQTTKLAIDTLRSRTSKQDFTAVELLTIVMEMEEKGQQSSTSDGVERDNQRGPIASGLPKAGFTIEIHDDDDGIEMTLAVIRKETEIFKKMFKCQMERSIVYVSCGYIDNDQQCEKVIATANTSRDSNEINYTIPCVHDDGK